MNTVRSGSWKLMIFYRGNTLGCLIDGGLNKRGVPKNRRFNRPKTKIYITEADIFLEKLISVPPFIKHPRVSL
jgi:hypothetical protein